MARVADALARLGAERRAGEVPALVVSAAVDVTGCAGAEVAAPSGEVAHRHGPPPSGPILEAPLRGPDGDLGTLRAWGGIPAPDAADALGILAIVAAQVMHATRVATGARLAEARAQRVGEAAADVASAGSRTDGLARLLTRARALLAAPTGAILVPDADGRLTPVLEDGVVPTAGADAWALPDDAAAAAAAGRLWFGEAVVDGEAYVLAIAPLAYGDATYGTLVLRGVPRLDEDERLLLDELADRGAAAVWIAALEEEVRELSTVDPVTRLYDGRYFRQRLDQEISRAARQEASLSVLILSFDGSAELRAKGRDAAADDALLDLAVHVGHNRRASDVACRLSGDEIAMILPDAEGLDAVLVAERIRSATASAIAAPTPRALSVGVATYPHAGAAREELIAAARSALGWARSHGGDRAFLYDREVAAMLEAEARQDIAGTENREDAFVATVYALAAAVDARDPCTHDHGRNVAHVASLIAQELGLPSQRVDEIRIAGLLHDVGKIGVSDRVLRKTTGLDDEEWEEMRQHPVVGNRILAGTKLDGVRPWILHHHERVDGGGYPDGLAGEAIPLESRIIAVAEALDAMVQGRSYRPAMTHAAAMREIQACAGTRYDPAVVAALQALAARGEPGVAPRPTS
ncbi:MAG: HD domain-containing phosphohydrolase [Actinomycetota bacterium]